MEEICMSILRLKKAIVQIVIPAIILTGLVILPASAQVTTASISGVVKDPSGAVVAEADIAIIDLGTNNSRNVKTNASGQYLVPDLPVGQYEMTVRMPGFATVKKTGIVLTVGAVSVQNITLAVGGTAEVVQVQADLAQVESTTSQLGALVDQRQMRELPLNGRNFEQLILLAPGVQPVTTGGQSSQYGRAPAYVNAGARPQGEAILLDGTDIVNFFGHGTGASVLGTSLGVEAIAEFQMLTNTYSAEFGGAGTAINSVSKSGTNEFHGSAYDFLRNSALDAKNYFDRPTAPIPAFKRNQFGGSLGGPIKQDSTFFFVNYEGIRQQLGLTGNTNVPNANARAGKLPGAATSINVSPEIQGLLNFWPLPNGVDNGDGTGQYLSVGQNPVKENYILARGDHKSGQKDSFFGRFVRDTGTYTDPFPMISRAGFLTNWPENDAAHNMYATLEYQRLATTNLINVMRYSYVRTDQGSSTASHDTVFPATLNLYGPGRPDATVTVTGLGGIGPYATNPFFYVQNKHTFEDQVYWTRGAHDLRFGGSIMRVYTNLDLPLYPGSTWNFTSLANLLNNVPQQVQGPLPGYTNSRRHYNEIDFAAYIQDNWKVRPNLTLNLGVRYEPTTNAVPGDKNTVLAAVVNVTDLHPTIVDHVLGQNASLRNIDPRIGLAYSPFAGNKTVIRVGAGTFHDPISVPRYSGSFNTFWPGYGFMTQSAPKFPILFQGVTLDASGMPVGKGVSLLSTATAMPYNTNVTPYMVQWNLNIERQISSGLIATIAYVGSRGEHLYVVRDANPVTIKADGTFGGPRINTLFGALNQTTPAALSKYHGLQTSLKGTISKSLQVQLYYTWSKTLDNSSNSTTGQNSNGTNQQTNPYDINYDYGRSAYDMRHNFTGNVIYELPFKGNAFISGYQLSLIAAVHSGPAYSTAIGSDRANLGNPLLSERPNLVGDPDLPGPVAANPTCIGPIAVHNAQHWFNPCAFTIPAAGTLGNLGRGALTGPGLVNFDMSLSKTTAVPQISERFKIQFRAEAFNLLNHPNFKLPSSFSAFTGTAGQIVQTTTTSRQLQFGLKFLF
jgi:outer membrane receptor protein involved in Fe transport